MDSCEEDVLDEVKLRLRSGLRHGVPRVGSDDETELLQDGLVMALHFLQSAKASGKAVTAGTLAFYALKHLRCGRRSTGCRRTDPLHAAAQLSHRSRVHSLEEPIPGVSEEPLTLGEVLASGAEDPASEAGRKLDWDWVTEQLDGVARAILGCLASGENLMVLVPRLGRSRSALQHHKERLARLIQDWLGADIMRQVQERPVWLNNVHATRQRMACRWERQATG